MKKKLLSLVFVFALGFLSSFTNTNVITNNDRVEGIYSRVYICGGKYAKKFHSKSSCRGLSNCRSEVYYYDSEQEAKENGYNYCKICWK